jgi:hypothetical protein
VSAAAPLVAWRNLRVVVPVAVVQASAYLLLNHLPLSAPCLLPLTAIDEMVPFLAWTVWPYLLLLSLMLWLPLLLRDRGVFREALLAYALAVPPTFLTFLVWPTTYPRPPAPADDGLTGGALRLLGTIDSPGCCCPSGHVVVPLVLVWGVWRDRHPWRVPLLLLVLLLVPTVLTTKQHYLWDVAAAFAVAGLATAAARRRTRRGPFFVDGAPPLP